MYVEQHTSTVTLGVKSNFAELSIYSKPSSGHRMNEKTMKTTAVVLMKKLFHTKLKQQIVTEQINNFNLLEKCCENIK